MIPGSANPLLLAADAGGYSIARSLRFNSADSAYLSRTFGTPNTQNTFTLSMWVKRAELGTTQYLFGVSTNHSFGFTSGDALNLTFGGVSALTTTAVFRDPSAWYHIVWAQNGTSHTIYVNNTSVGTATATSSVFNTAVAHQIGAANTANFFSGLLAYAWFVDGSALTPSSFGQANPTTGVWDPIVYTGSKPGNSSLLDFADNSAATATTLGKDTSGNGNNWTPNNLSVTAGAGNDSLVDSPTNGTASSGGDAGGVVTGNYCCWNPLKNPGGSTGFSNGNLETTFALSGVFPVPMGTFGVSSGKWYWEITPTSGASGAGGVGVGIGNKDCGPTSAGAFGVTANGWGYYFNGDKYNSNSSLSYGASYTNNDVIGAALDCDNGTLVFYKNGVSQGTAYTGLTNGPYFPAVGNAGDTTTVVANFGQRPFAYAAPAGFKSLNTANLPTPTILKGSDYFDTKLYTGNGSTQTISGLGFQPEFVWIKGRSGATDHALYDAIRGTQARLESNTTDAEVTSDSGLTAFNSDGFSLSTLAQVNTSSATYAAWCWDAAGSNSTNTAGSITSTVRANASAGFSIATLTTQSSGTGTFGHGLGVAPYFYLVKTRGITSNWWAYHQSLPTAQSNAIALNSTAAAIGSTTLWNDTSPSSNLIYLGADWAGGLTVVVYAFAPVSGYSSFGSYTGNGSTTDGTFVYTGMRPRFVMLKRSDSTGNWVIWDSARNTYNVANSIILPNSSAAEYSPDAKIDFLSNGFKIRDNSSDSNASSATYVYACFSENPFSIARAR